MKPVKVTDAHATSMFPVCIQIFKYITLFPDLVAVICLYTNYARWPVHIRSVVAYEKKFYLISSAVILCRKLVSYNYSSKGKTYK